MNAGEQVIDFLYAEQLQVDDQWAVRTPTGFTWWAGHNAQTIEIVGEETAPDGLVGYVISVRTEMVTDLDLTDAALADLNDGPMAGASMAGPVYDADARRLDLWSLVRVTDDNGDWIRFLLAAAAVIQLAEARVMAPVLAQATGALTATSAHQESGARTVPDQMAFAASGFAELGEAPSAWTGAECRAVADQYMDGLGSPAVVGQGGVSVELPFGERSSLCRLITDQPHPLYGNGLLVLQSFPVDLRQSLGESADPDTEGIKLALSLNAAGDKALTKPSLIEPVMLRLPELVWLLRLTTVRVLALTLVTAMTSYTLAVSVSTMM